MAVTQGSGSNFTGGTWGVSSEPPTPPTLKKRIHNWYAFSIHQYNPKAKCIYSSGRVWLALILENGVAIGERLKLMFPNLVYILQRVKDMYPRKSCGCWVSCQGHPEDKPRPASQMTATEVIRRQQQSFYTDPTKYVQDVSAKAAHDAIIAYRHYVEDQQKLEKFHRSHSDFDSLKDDMLAVVKANPQLDSVEHIERVYNLAKDYKQVKDKMIQNIITGKDKKKDPW